jgi:entry exclusion lipoprotein TrbK
MVCAGAALVFTGYKEFSRKPELHAVNEAACTPQAIKSIDNITERAIQSSKCARRDK